MGLRKISVTLAVTTAFVLGSFFGVPAVLAHSDNHNHKSSTGHNKHKGNPDVYTQKLFRDGSVSCTGADDTTKRGGRVSLFPGNNEVHFKITLKNASPNSTYTVAVSQEPNCANAQFFNDAIVTDGSGGAVFYGTYDNNGSGLPAGEYNLLVNMVTAAPDKAENREIATKNARVEIPGL